MSAELRLRELLERLVAAEVRFVLVGGLAVNAWGYLRATQDVDIVPDPEPANLERLASLLERLDGKVEVEGGRLKSSAIRTFLKAGDRTLVSTEAGHVDVLQGLPQVPPFSQLDGDGASVDLDGITVKVCSLDALKAMKAASERARDRDDLEALDALDE
ncbi:MAG TPA: nucleotidyltransferase [Thermoleophilaceae bacterium]|nr:nucleotidyltransferase [Thermoleophilaceae bacterium]